MSCHAFFKLVLLVREYSVTVVQLQAVAASQKAESGTHIGCATILGTSSWQKWGGHIHPHMSIHPSPHHGDAPPRYNFTRRQIPQPEETGHFTPRRFPFTRNADNNPPRMRILRTTSTHVGMSTRCSKTCHVRRHSL